MYKGVLRRYIKNCDSEFYELKLEIIGLSISFYF